MSNLTFSQFDINALADQLSDSKKLVEMAKIAENAERYEDMCCFMRMRVENFIDEPLSVDERNYLSVAFKNVIGARRASWRHLQGELQSPENETEAGEMVLEVYKRQIENELETISKNVLDLLEKRLIVGAKKSADENPEELVFYLKMAGDYYRYLTESVAKDEYKHKTQEFYSEAHDVATTSLASTHPIRLGLALNYSVCKYEILKDPKEACAMAKKAFDDAISQLDDLKESDYKDSTLIMQLLRDNLTLWTSADTEDDTVVEDLDN